METLINFSICLDNRLRERQRKRVIRHVVSPMVSASLSGAAAEPPTRNCVPPPEPDSPNRKGREGLPSQCKKECWRVEHILVSLQLISCPQVRFFGLITPFICLSMSIAVQMTVSSTRISSHRPAVPLRLCSSPRPSFV